MMINHLSIKNFKSIRELELQCKRVNVFLGEPNAGKSNLLESIGLFSCEENGVGEVIRMGNFTDLFFNQEVTNAIHVDTDAFSVKVVFEGTSRTRFLFNARGVLSDMSEIKTEIFYDNIIADRVNFTRTGSLGFFSGKVKYYKFSPNTESHYRISGPLVPPFGSNLFAVLLTNKEVKETVSEIIRSTGYRLVLKPTEGKIEIQKEKDGVVYSFPYTVVSDTLKRIIFYVAAMDSNKESILIFEEPEANTFPFFTNQLAEKIAADESNQYFLVTHNPYLLQTLIQKTPTEDLQVNICYTHDFETKVKQLESPSGIEEMISLDSSVFFNFDQFIDE